MRVKMPWLNRRRVPAEARAQAVAQLVAKRMAVPKISCHSASWSSTAARRSSAVRTSVAMRACSVFSVTTSMAAA